mmetsp:Transcript_48607/g.87332  ORF Transcript_48607/g.87332 Transcript_48607/m.87332 type:complete len:313 (-) Transcript_48607:1640-2578(-)
MSQVQQSTNVRHRRWGERNLCALTGFFVEIGEPLEERAICLVKGRKARGAGTRNSAHGSSQRSQNLPTSCPAESEPELSKEVIPRREALRRSGWEALNGPSPAACSTWRLCEQLLLHRLQVRVLPWTLSRRGAEWRHRLAWLGRHCLGDSLTVASNSHESSITDHLCLCYELGRKCRQKLLRSSHQDLLPQEWIQRSDERGIVHFGTHGWSVCGAGATSGLIFRCGCGCRGSPLVCPFLLTSPLILFSENLFSDLCRQGFEHSRVDLLEAFNGPRSAATAAAGSRASPRPPKVVQADLRNHPHDDSSPHVFW